MIDPGGAVIVRVRAKPQLPLNTRLVDPAYSQCQLSIRYRIVHRPSSPQRHDPRNARTSKMDSGMEAW
jgi:hypothetical protein